MLANQSVHNVPTVKKENEVIRSVLWIVGSLVVALFIRTFLFAPFVVNGASMEPNFHHGDRMIVNKVYYLMGDLSRGDVIVFHADQNREYIKRVIATEGETVQMKSDQLYINGAPVNEDYLNKALDFFHQKGLQFTNDFGPVTVPKDEVFVLGDNRVDSTDSRVLGAIKQDEMVGRVSTVFWSSQ